MKNINLDEEIKKAQSIADAKSDCWSHCNDTGNDCKSCEEQHKQLAAWLMQLKEYQQLEKQGRLVKLPCIAGSEVYVIVFDYEQEQYGTAKTKIIEVNQNCNGWFFRPLISIPAFKIDDFGKAVFLTKAEAEAKLKEMNILTKV